MKFIQLLSYIQLVLRLIKYEIWIMLKALYKISVIIFVAEIIIMFGLDETVREMPLAYQAILDGLLLALISFPPIYFLVIKPYMGEAEKARVNYQKNASELAAIVESVVEAIVTIDAKGTIKTVNLAAEHLFGYEHGEMIDQNVKILMTGHHSTHHDKYLSMSSVSEKARIFGNDRKLAGKRKDHTVFPIHVSIAEMAVTGEKMYTGIMRDLTQEKEFTEKLEQQLVELEFQRQAVEESAQKNITIMESLTEVKEELSEKNTYLQEIMNNTGQGVLVFSSQLLLAAWNDTFLEILDLKGAEFREHMTLLELLELDKKKIFLNNLTPEDYIDKTKRRIASRAKKEVYFRDLKLDDGIIIKLTQRIMDDGSVVTMSRDVTLEREEEERIRTIALRDGLTGLANRRAFDAQIEDVLNIYRSQETPFLLAFIDLDDFKAVNDTYGHGVGDAVLQFAASTVQSRIRDADIAVRLGGDEFAIIFRETDDAALAEERLNNIIKDIQAIDELEGYPITVGASAGLACCPYAGADASILMEAADKALYQAKKRGKGQVCSYTA